ncbi:hypothetical protein Dimus_003709 [Dionaea muscipula]
MQLQPGPMTHQSAELGGVGGATVVVAEDGDRPAERWEEIGQQKVKLAKSVSSRLAERWEEKEGWVAPQQASSKSATNNRLHLHFTSRSSQSQSFQFTLDLIL